VRSERLFSSGHEDEIEILIGNQQRECRAGKVSEKHVWHHQIRREMMINIGHLIFVLKE
jgi:hypothetical protein